MSSEHGVPLTDLVELSVKYQRSVRIESVDSALQLARGYIATDRAVGLINRLSHATAPGPRTRAWSITGPYGSGKSSAVAFCAALLGDSSHDLHAKALQRLAAEDSSAADLVVEARQRAVAADKGYMLAVTTAGREPVGTAIVRALSNAAERYWTGRGRKPAVLSRVRRMMSNGHTSDAEILDLLCVLEEYAPVLLVLDEFGKVLEYTAQNPSQVDLYTLQLLAEHVSTATSVPSMFLTIQHLSVSDYFQALPAVHRREWLKVQGRFEDVLFAGSCDEAIAFIRGHLHTRGSESVNDSVNSWGDTVRRAASCLGNYPLHSLSSSAESTYPLHPLVLFLAPLISQRFSQGDRSLHSWLASDEPGSVAGFLSESCIIPGEAPPVYGPEGLFTYFMDRAVSTQRATHSDSRWLEIVSRIGEANDLAYLEDWLLKLIGLVNLSGVSGELPASFELLLFAVEVQGLGDEPAVRRAIESLESKGYVTYRRHASEYRVWQGSDVDLESEAARIRDSLAGSDDAFHLARLAPTPSRVAQRHGHETGTFRHFLSTYHIGQPDSDRLRVPDEVIDGLLVYCLADKKDFDTRSVADTVPDGRAVVVCVSPDLPQVTLALQEALVLDRLAEQSSVAGDPVARREVRERQACALSSLRKVLRDAFDPNRHDLKWYAIGRPVEVRGAKAVSELLSRVCDRVYDKRLVLNNEILNRTQLTSQGAAARRTLLEHMLSDPEVEAFGISGHGPERSMYDSFFRALRLHRKTKSGSWGLARPGRGSGAHCAWSAIDDYVSDAGQTQRSLADLFALLSRPPYGVRQSVIPVLALTFLAVHHDDTALYQDGTFEPQLTVPLLERLLKSPERFSVRRVINGGLRRQVTESLLGVISQTSPSVSVNSRNESLLQVLRPMLSMIRRLPDYSLYTSRLSNHALAVRAALVSAQELEDLLFERLPAAVGVQPFGLDEKPAAERVSEYAALLVSALREIEDGYSSLLQEAEASIAEVFRVRERQQVRSSIRNRAWRMEGQVIDRRLGSFIVRAIDDTMSDLQWLEAMCMSLTDKSMPSWRDVDVDIFDTRLREVAGLFHRVELLCCEADVRETPDGFLARRLAVTHPDGTEIGGVVWAHEGEMRQLRLKANDVIAELGREHNLSELEALLAIMVEEVLDSTTQESTITSQEAEEGGVLDVNEEAG